MRVERTKTPFTLAEYTRALLIAWFRHYGAYPTEKTCAVLWSQYALETGRGAACWNNNIGNVKHHPTDGFDYFELPNTWEMDANGNRHVYQPPDPQTWFRAYPTLEDAMEHHIAFLIKRYSKAWDAAKDGQPDTFAAELKRLGYYTASAAVYTRGLVSLTKEFERSKAYVDAVATLDRPPTDPEMVQPRNPDLAGEGIADAAVAEYQKVKNIE